MTICHTKDTTFAQDLVSEGLTLVNFWATWCGPCRMFGPILEAFDQEYSAEVRTLKVNVDEDADTAARFGIMSIPTTILFKDGEPIAKLNGVVRIEELKRFIADHRK